MPGLIFENLQKTAAASGSLGRQKSINFIQEKSSEKDVRKKSSDMTLARSAAGLGNMGNTCYLNSVLQCLCHTDVFRMYLLSKEHSATCKNKGFCAGCSMESLVTRMFMSSTGSNTLYPKEIVNNVKKIGKTLRSGRQEDAHEFFSFLLDKLTSPDQSKQTKDKNSCKKNIPPNPFHSMFTGALESQIVCTECKHVSRKADPMTTLSLEVQGTSSLATAFSQFCRPEILSGSNKYQCEKCKKRVVAQKRLMLKDLPPVLAIQLKRFGFGRYGQPTKLSQSIQFPEHMDLRTHLAHKDSIRTSTRYSLYGVLVHAGSSTHSGHYYCYIKTNKGWLELDDSSVRSVSLQTVMSQKAYMLFYEREDAMPCLTRPDKTKPTVSEGSEKAIDLAQKEKTPKVKKEKEKIPGSLKAQVDNESNISPRTSKKSEDLPAQVKTVDTSSHNPEGQDYIGYNSTTYWIVKPISLTHIPPSTTPTTFTDRDMVDAEKRIPTPPLSPQPNATSDSLMTECDKKLTFVKDKSPRMEFSPSPTVSSSDIAEDTSKPNAPVLEKSSSSISWSTVSDVASWDTPEIPKLLYKRERLLESTAQKRYRPDQYDLEYDAPKQKKIKNRNSKQRPQ